MFRSANSSKDLKPAAAACISFGVLEIAARRCVPTSPQPARMRSFVAGITEAIAYIRRRPTEAKGILQKYTRVSDPSILQHA